MANPLMRNVTAPINIGGKILQGGRNVLMPYRVLHFDPEVWGADASVFDPDRFLRRKELQLQTLWRGTAHVSRTVRGRTGHVHFRALSLSSKPFPIM